MRDARIIGIVLLLIMVLPLGAGAQDECVAAQGEPLVIGAVFPRAALLTARSGESLNGAEAMRSAINACGGVHGRPLEWQLVEAQDRYSAEAAVQTLAAAGVPLIVGSGSPAVSEGAREAADAAGVVYWEVSEAVEAPGAWTFSPRPNGRQMGQDAARLIDAQFPAARTALIYEDSAPARAIAAGVRDTLLNAPLIDEEYNGGDDYGLALRLREERIDALLLITFESDGYFLWYNAREADANVDAWLHIGGTGYWRGLCARQANVEGFMSLAAYGPVSVEYRQSVMGTLEQEYREAYTRAQNTPPSLEADLSAAGVYLLLRYGLPALEGDWSAENMRATLQALTVEMGSGMLGEGLLFVAGVNQAAVSIVRQQQNRLFCSVAPEAVATCLTGVQPLPTWRERARATNWGCAPEA
ncbi:MAG: ABC transporter substrate-binding protein [Chloroflexi bacterium]|nr:ABC transporter substrate-binding protein [Chloroflexota bacterium]